MPNTEARDVGSWHQSREVCFSSRDPYSEHGVDGDVSDSDGDHFVLDIFGVVSGIDSLKTGEVFGEMFVGEVFEDVLFVVDGLLAVNSGHGRELMKFVNVELNLIKLGLMFYLGAVI